MSDLDNLEKVLSKVLGDLVTQITRATTQAVLEHFQSTPVSSEQDTLVSDTDMTEVWDEYNAIPATTPASSTPSRKEPSALRARLLAGQITDGVSSATGDDIAAAGPGIGKVIPIGQEPHERGMGYIPTDDWITKRYQVEVVAARRAAPWEQVVRQVK
jgi:hypothetical protein